MRPLQPIGATRTEIECDGGTAARFTCVVIAHVVIFQSAVGSTERWKVTRKDALLSPDEVTDEELLSAGTVHWEEFQAAAEVFQCCGDRKFALKALRLLLLTMWA